MLIRLSVAAVFGVLPFLSPLNAQELPRQPSNLDFESPVEAGHEQTIPAGWLAAGSHPQYYDMRVDGAVAHTGGASGHLGSRGDEIAGFGTLMTVIQAEEYWLLRVRLSAYIKTEDVSEWAGLWMRVDGSEQGELLGFDNMMDRPITGTTGWERYEVVLDVPAGSSRAIAFGVLLAGTGKVWIDDVRLDEVGTDIQTTNMRD